MRRRGRAASPRRQGPEQRAEAALEAVVRRVLAWDVFVPDAGIRASVEGGTVVLEGVVATAAQRDEATRAVRCLAGVGGVVNRLRCG